MKKMFLLSLFFLIVFIGFSTYFDNFVYYTDFQQLQESDDQHLQLIGKLLKRWETGSSASINNFDISQIELAPDDKMTVEILYQIEPYVYLKPIQLFEQALINYQDSIIINSMYLFYNFQYWINTKDTKAANIIFEYVDKIERLMGEKTPLTVYYKAQVLTKSNIYIDFQTAYEELIKMYYVHPKDENIIETLVEIIYQIGETSEIEKIYNDYIEIKGNNPETYLYFSKIFYNLGQNQKSKEIAKYAISLTKNVSILTQIYEFLGDIEEDYSQKIEYYRKALNNDRENGRLMAKIGTAYYELDKKENADLARYFLNAAESRNYINEEIESMLKSLRSKVIVGNFLKFLLPIIILVIFSLWLLNYLDKRKNRKEKDLLNKD